MIRDARPPMMSVTIHMVFSRFIFLSPMIETIAQTIKQEKTMMPAGHSVQVYKKYIYPGEEHCDNTGSRGDQDIPSFLIHGLKIHKGSFIFAI